MSPEIPAEALPWKPDSWRRWPALQQPNYPDPTALDRVLAELRVLPPLVTSWEIVQLRQQLAEAAAGTRFVLQAGDCAERFAACTPNRITNMLKVLLQMSLVLVVGAQKPVIRIGRFAGQYAKPRSSHEETRDGVTLPSFRGDNINRPEFTAEARTPDPQLLLRGYERASLTLNFIRSLVKSGFADLHHPEYFDLDWVEHSPLADEYHHMVGTIGDALRFMENVLGVRAGETDRIDFFTTHEALHLGYESAQTRTVPRRPGYFNLTTHFPWVGLRTNDPGGAHVEYLRGIQNPVAIKVGTDFTREQVAGWLEALDPNRQAGRLTLIHRHQSRDGLHPRAGGRLARGARSQPPGGPADADPSLRRRPHCGRAAAPDRGRTRRRRVRAVGLRSHARQHADDRRRLENPQLRRHHFRSGTGLRHPPRHGSNAGRSPHRTDRRKRDRVHWRIARPGRARPGARLRIRSRPAPQLRAVARAGIPDRPQNEE